jgi:hypothetical protein
MASGSSPGCVVHIISPLIVKELIRELYRRMPIPKFRQLPKDYRCRPIRAGTRLGLALVVVYVLLCTVVALTIGSLGSQFFWRKVLDAQPWCS